MKNLFDLQLFNDAGSEPTEGAGGAEGAEGKDEPTPKPADPKNELKYTDEDLDRIIEKKLAKWKKDNEKKVSEAERFGKMTEAEKAVEKLKSLETRIQEYEQRELRADMTRQARAVLQDADIHVSDELLSNLVADDAETTKASVENFVSLFNAAVEKAVKEKLKGETPKAGKAPSGLTKEQILAIPNTKERQKAISENIHLFQ